jgi:hypothetical protein
MAEQTRPFGSNVARLGGIGRTVDKQTELPRANYEARETPIEADLPPAPVAPAASPPVRQPRRAKHRRPPREQRAPRPRLARVEPSTPVHKMTFVAAMMLATVSGGYSIFGMASIFVGALWPVIGMGVALEIGKLSAVSWFGANRGSGPLRASLFGLVGVLMVLNAIGAYGFLARAHIGQQLAGDIATMGRGAEVEAKLSEKRAQISDIDTRIKQIDEAVSTATKKGRTNGAMDLAQAQRKSRDMLTAQRAASMSELTKLTVEAASVEGERKMAAADLGPALYLATLMGVSPDDMLRWFILLVAILLDPAAVLLLMAATSPRRRA